MKTNSIVMFSLAGMFALVALPSCTAHIDTPAVTTGAATTTTTTQRVDPYAGATTTERRTTTTQY